LRPGEVYALTRLDLRLITHPGPPPALIVALRKPKTRATAGRCQFVILHDVPAIKWIVWCFWGLPMQARLWARAAHDFRRRFGIIMERLHVKGLGLTPGSLRPGGAAHLYVSGETVERLQHKGRWKSIATLRIYTQEAACALAWARAGPKALALIQSLLSSFAALLVSPPLCPRNLVLPAWRPTR